jgi:hypothetical protein
VRELVVLALMTGLVVHVAGTGAAAVGTSESAALRTILSLDGTWKIGEGGMDQPPGEFGASVPVPGLVDEAVPAFHEVGTTSPLRDAFWYSRTFTIAGEVPARAVLKISKAAYNTRVVLNGKLVGDHAGAFTPGYFNLRSALRGNGAENTLLVRVGANLKQLPPDAPDGHDFEKILYTPGIYDSVSLILSGAPYIERLQVVPDIEHGTARVFCEAGGITSGPAELTCTIREKKSGAAVGTLTTTTRLIAGAAVELPVPLRSPHLWMPEDPFLYEVELSTTADTSTATFGMRTFSIDAQSGRAMLNGKPYYLRGTNVCIFRFFEDPARKHLPWNAEWVRNLHRSFKDMHWNSMRYCIGFPPEAWYDIADEEGFLIQDEFPIWGWFGKQPQFTADSVAAQYAEWIPERWNHPSVAIWDGQNETVTTITEQAIAKVRHMDRAQRPWDNGWGPGREPGDSFECHPYVFINPSARISTLRDIGDDYLGSPQKPGNNGLILNEYGWLWINRDGSPCTLTTKLYENLLGTTATAEQRRETYAKYLAVLTEFWRAERRFAGVLHFCGLSYSRAGGQTSDNFVDVEGLKFEPNFYRHVRDAFSPVGVCIDYYEENLFGKKQQTVPVTVINDLAEPAECNVTFYVRQGSVDAQTNVTTCTVPAGGKVTLKFDANLDLQPGGYQFVAELGTATQPPASSSREFRILTSAEAGLAFNRPVRASSVFATSGKRPMVCRAENAVDGQEGTRWASKSADEQFLAVQLEKRTQISRVELLWENAYAKEYALETSDDGTSWSEVYHTAEGAGGRETVRFTPTTARWIRMRGIKRATKFGYSLYEFRVFSE